MSIKCVGLLVDLSDRQFLTERGLPVRRLTGVRVLPHSYILIMKMEAGNFFSGCMFRYFVIFNCVNRRCFLATNDMRWINIFEVTIPELSTNN